MNNNPIGFIDSGLGGLTILKETIKLLPQESYVFYADNLNIPYGNKTIGELTKVAQNGIKWLIKHNVKIIVIACGTISTNIADYLQSIYKNITFIKTIPIIDDIKIDNKTLFMATKATCESKIISKYKDQMNILPCIELASLIEENNEEKLNLYLNKMLSNYNDIDQIILGCTHYPLIKDKINNYFKEAKVIDFSKIIANKVKGVLEENNLFAKDNYNLIIYNTKEDEEYLKKCLSIIKES